MKKSSNIKNQNFIFMPHEIKNQFDDYIENIIVPLLEVGEETPIVEPQYWDLLILLRYSGLRLQEALHLIAEHMDKTKEFLQYSLENGTKFYLNYCLFKHTPIVEKSVRYLDGSSDLPKINMIEQAIIRQKKRVKNLPPASDGHYYLFRELNSKSEIVIMSAMKISLILKKISEGIPLENSDGSFYRLSVCQFRNQVITDEVI